MSQRKRNSVVSVRGNARSRHGSRKGRKKSVSLSRTPSARAVPSLGFVVSHSLQKEPLPTTFPCLFCNHEKSVSVKMDKKAGTGELSCKVCGQSFQTGINCESQDTGAVRCRRRIGLDMLIR